MGVGIGVGAGSGSGSGSWTVAMWAVKVSLSHSTWAPSCSETKRRGTMVLSFPSHFTTPAGTPPGRSRVTPSTAAEAEPRVRTMVCSPRSRSTCRFSGTHTTVAPRASATLFPSPSSRYTCTGISLFRQEKVISTRACPFSGPRCVFTK